MVATTSSIDRAPVHRIAIENVSILIGIFPVFDMFNDGRESASGSEVAVLIVYGSYR